MKLEDLILEVLQNKTSGASTTALKEVSIHLVNALRNEFFISDKRDRILYKKDHMFLVDVSKKEGVEMMANVAALSPDSFLPTELQWLRDKYAVQFEECPSDELDNLLKRQLLNHFGVNVNAKFCVTDQCKKRLLLKVITFADHQRCDLTSRLKELIQDWFEVSDVDVFESVNSLGDTDRLNILTFLERIVSGAEPSVRVPLQTDKFEEELVALVKKSVENCILTPTAAEEILDRLEYSKEIREKNDLLDLLKTRGYDFSRRKEVLDYIQRNNLKFSQVKEILSL